MPHLVNATGFRLSKRKKWQSLWVTGKSQYKKYLLEDLSIRKFLMERLKNAGVEKVEIERSANDVKLSISVARPGLVIGRGGSGIESLRKDLLTKISGRLKNFNVLEIKKPELSAKLVAENLASQIVRRFPHKRAIDQAIERTIAAGAKGIKVEVGGRLGGSDQARTEKKSSGEVPLSTINSDIDYGFSEAQTKYGTIGVKIWIHK